MSTTQQSKQLLLDEGFLKQHVEGRMGSPHTHSTDTAALRLPFLPSPALSHIPPEARVRVTGDVKVT